MTPATSIDINWELLTGIGGFLAGVLAMIFRKGKAVQAIESKLEQHTQQIAQLQQANEATQASIERTRTEVLGAVAEVRNTVSDISKMLYVAAEARAHDAERRNFR